MYLIGKFFGKASTLAFLAFCFTTTTAFGAFLFSDDTFSDSNWLATAVLKGPSGATFTQSATHADAGGNPGAFRTMTHTWGDNTDVVVYHQYLGGTYNPSVEGAISKVNYSEDNIIVSAPISGSVGWGMIVVQNGVTYRTGGNGFGNTSWQTSTLPNLSANDFTDLEATGLAHPNFTSTGSELSVGYWRSTTIPVPTISIVHGIDTWKITLSPVPEPTSAAIAIIAFSVVAFKRRR
jgi:hypothetical protein